MDKETVVKQVGVVGVKHMDNEVAVEQMQVLAVKEVAVNQVEEKETVKEAAIEYLDKETAV